MGITPESYAVELEFAESQDDPFEAILELRARVAALDEERESIIKTAENMGGRRPESALDAMNAAVNALVEMGRRKADHQARADKAEARVAELQAEIDKVKVWVREGRAVGGVRVARAMYAWVDQSGEVGS